ncbi:hypothetical protein Ancab_033304, partial [Ancistrocladus abbreviatus]
MEECGLDSLSKKEECGSLDSNNLDSLNRVLSSFRNRKIARPKALLLGGRGIKSSLMSSKHRGCSHRNKVARKKPTVAVSSFR